MYAAAGTMTYPTQYSSYIHQYIAIFFLSKTTGTETTGAWWSQVPQLWKLSLRYAILLCVGAYDITACIYVHAHVGYD